MSPANSNQNHVFRHLVVLAGDYAGDVVAVVMLSATDRQDVLRWHKELLAEQKKDPALVSKVYSGFSFVVFYGGMTSKVGDGSPLRSLLKGETCVELPPSIKIDGELIETNDDELHIYKGGFVISGYDVHGEVELVTVTLPYAIVAGD